MHFVENLQRQHLYRVNFPYLQNSAHVFFFDTAGNCVFNSIFAILENFNIQKIIERLDINPNLKNQSEDYRLRR